MKIRSSGILLPLQSLFTGYGIGDMGPEAYRFLEFLHEAGQHIWQILPVNPTLEAHGHSPYHSPSTFAFNPLLISPEQMVEDGFLEKKDLPDIPVSSRGLIDYKAAATVKEKLFKKAFSRFQPDQGFDDFCAQQDYWLEDYSLFTALGNHFKSNSWHLWPERIRKRDPKALKSANRQLADYVSLIRFVQYLCYKQWGALKNRCNEKGIQIMGDLPIYVPHESADTWKSPHLFKFDKHMYPRAVSGVPPDYFSETGQLWGHPVFKWKAHTESGFEWWTHRIRHHLALYDYLRIDHFRGLVAYWEIPANEKTAVNGRWIKAPTRAFFNTLFRSIPSMPIIAEDLGYITADVREILRDYDIPGMRVLVFGFSSPAQNPNAPHNVDESCVVYTGTHDTNTARGWFEEEAGDKGRKEVFQYFDTTMTADGFVRELVRTAQGSPAWLCIIPMQDLLVLGSEARINRPGTTFGNWQWRLTDNQFNPAMAKTLRQAAEIFGRI